MKLEAYELQNSGVTISRKLFNITYSKYKAMFSDACRKLYELCYQGSPSELSLIEIVKAMREEFPQYLKLFVSEIDASLSWTAKHSSYVLDIAKAKGYSDEFIQLVSLLHDAFEAKEALAALDSLDSHSRIKTKQCVTEVIHPRVNISTRVRDASKYKCDNPAVRELFVIPDGYQIVEVNTKCLFRDQALRMLGVSEEDIMEFNLTDEAAFSSCLSKEAELRHLEMFLSGAVKSDGRFAKLLNAKLTEEAQYSIANKGGITVVQKFVERAFIDSLNARCEAVTAFRKELEEQYADVKVFYVSSDIVYFEVTKSGFNSNTSHTSVEFEVPEIVHGSPALDYCSGEYLPLYTAIEGVSGEYILQGDLMNKGYYTESKPVKVKFLSKVGNRIKEQILSYYPISEVYYSSEKNAKGELITKTLVPKVGNEISSLEIMSEEALFKKIGAMSKLSAYYALRFRISVEPEFEGVSGAYLDLVADLLCAYYYISNGLCSYTMINSDYSYVTKEMYNKACYEAYELFKRL